MANDILSELEKLKRDFFEQVCKLEMKAIEAGDLGVIRQTQFVRMTLTKEI